MASNKRVTSAKDFNNRVDETTCSWTPVSLLPQPLPLPLNGLTNKVARVTGTEETVSPAPWASTHQSPRGSSPAEAPLQPQGPKPRPQGEAFSLRLQVGCTHPRRGLAPASCSALVLRGALLLIGASLLSRARQRRALACGCLPFPRPSPPEAAGSGQW